MSEITEIWARGTFAVGIKMAGIKNYKMALKYLYKNKLITLDEVPSGYRHLCQRAKGKNSNGEQSGAGSAT